MGEPVEKIVGYRIDNNIEYFQVQWSKNDITWEPFANLNCPRLLKEFAETLFENRRKKNKEKKKTDDSLKFKKAPPVNRYASNNNAFTNAAPTDKPTSLRDMFAKNNRYSSDNFRPPVVNYDYQRRFNYQKTPIYQDNFYNPAPPVAYYPEEENDEFNSIPYEEYKPKSGVLTQLIVNKFDLGEIRFAWVSGSLKDDHTLPPAVYLTKVVNWSKVFVLLMGFYMDPANSTLDIFSVAPANNLGAFSELVSTLTRCEKAAVDWASSGHVFLVFPLFENLRSKFGLSITESSSMICLKIPAEFVELGNLNSIDGISSLLIESEKSVTWLSGSPRYQQELENCALHDLSQLDFNPGTVTFAVYGPEDCYELQEASRQLISLKATYSSSLFIRSVNVVLIAKSYLQFLHAMPNFIHLKWRKVQFFVLARKVSLTHQFRLSFKNILPKGGVVTVTRQFLLDSALDSFTNLIKWTQNPKSDWIIRIPASLYDEFSRFLAIQQSLQNCIENFPVIGASVYASQLEYKYSATHRHFIIIDKEPFSFLDSSSIQVMTASKVVDLFRQQHQMF